jgi:hypothetical protein
VDRTNRHRLLTATLLAASILLAAGAGATPYFPGARAIGMGEAYSAVSDDVGALEFNPAGMSQVQAYTVGANYQRVEFFPSRDAKKKEILDLWHTAVTDSASSKYMAAGVSLTANGFPNVTFKNNEGYRISLGVAFPGGDFVHIGACGRYLKFMKDDPQADGWTADAGILFTPSTWIHIGAVGRNLVPQKHEELAPGEMALALSSSLFGYVTLTAETTWNWELKTTHQWNFHVGAEALFWGQLAVRGGYFFDEVHEKDFYGIGMGYVNEKGAVGYSFRQNPENVKEFTHAVQVMVRFGSAPSVDRPKPRTGRQ